MTFTSRSMKSTNSGRIASTRPKKEWLLMGFARAIAERSTCERLQVGAVVTNDTFDKIEAFGYNGNYKGGPNTCDSKEPGNCGCLHAEMNALLKAGNRGHTIFITTEPCKMCAKAIVNAGIKMVYYSNPYRLHEGLKVLKKAKIKYAHLS